MDVGTFIWGRFLEKIVINCWGKISLGRCKNCKIRCQKKGGKKNSKLIDMKNFGGRKKL